MGILELVLVAIKGISVVTNNPAFGGGSNLKLQEASELLSLLGELASRGKEGHKELKAFTATIGEMVANNRAPTVLEWEELRARSDAAHAAIQEAVAAADQAEAEAEAEKQRLKEEALKKDIARLNDEDLLAAAESLGINAEGVERETIEALVLEAKLAE